MLEQWKRYIFEVFEWIGEMHSSEPEHLLAPIKVEEPAQYRRQR